MFRVLHAGGGAAEFLDEPGAGVERAAVLVDGDEKRVRVVPVDVLGAVAVVAVGVHDGHLFYAVGLSEELDHDGFVVDVAKPPRAVHDLHGVVAGRAHQREPPFHAALHDRHADGLSASRADEMGFGHHVPNAGHAEMNPLDVPDRHQVGTQLLDSLDVENSLLEHLVLGIQQTLLPFGVRGADSPIERGKKTRDLSCLLLRACSAPISSNVCRSFSCRNHGSGRA